MKRAFYFLGIVLTSAFALSAATGCEVACAEDEQNQGGTCVAKSLTRFNGTDVSKSATWASGGTVTIDGVYGDITNPPNALGVGVSNGLSATFGF